MTARRWEIIGRPLERWNQRNKSSDRIIILWNPERRKINDDKKKETMKKRLINEWRKKMREKIEKSCGNLINTWSPKKEIPKQVLKRRLVPRLIVVPLSSHEIDGVRKEKERLTAASDSHIRWSLKSLSNFSMSTSFLLISRFFLSMVLLIIKIAFLLGSLSLSPVKVVFSWNRFFLSGALFLVLGRCYTKVHLLMSL